MKMRVTAVVVLAFALGAAPAQAGLFGWVKGKKTLPQAPSAVERVGHYAEPAAKAKPSNSADRHGVGQEHVQQLHRQPIVVTNPWVRQLR